MSNVVVVDIVESDSALKQLCRWYKDKQPELEAFSEALDDLRDHVDGNRRDHVDGNRRARSLVKRWTRVENSCKCPTCPQ